MPDLKQNVFEAVKELTREHGQHGFGINHIIGEIADPKPTPEEVVEAVEQLADYGKVVTGGRGVTVSVTLSSMTYEGFL